MHISGVQQYHVVFVQMEESGYRRERQVFGLLQEEGVSV